MTQYALLDRPNPTGPNFYTDRRKKVVAFVMHVSVGLQDLDMLGIDHSDAGLCRYAQTTTRDVSWHSQSDSDSYTRMIPDSYTGWHCQGYNSTTVGHEICKRNPDWRQGKVTLKWTDATLMQAARCIAPRALALGIPFKVATKSEVDHAIATNGRPVGFIHHGRLDPDRRTDAGLVWVDGKKIDTFPWLKFFDFCRKVVAKPVPTPTPVPSGGLTAADRQRIRRVQYGCRVERDGYWWRDTDRAATVIRSWAYGPATNAAPRTLQTVLKVPVDGVVGPNTRRALKWSVEQIQIALAVESDGAWGPNTERAYQAARRKYYMK